MIPAGEDIERFEVEGDIAWVLIVEKEVTIFLHSNPDPKIG